MRLSSFFLICLQNPEAQGTVDLNDSLTINLSQALRDITLALARDFEHGPEPGSVVLPKDLRKAALQLLRFSALGVGDQYRRRLAGDFSRSRCLLEKGREELLRSLRPKNGLIQEAVLPGGVISLLTQHLTRDTTVDAPNIESTYFDYALKLVSTIPLLAQSI